MQTKRPGFVKTKPRTEPKPNQPSRTEIDEPPLEARNQCIMRNTTRPSTVVITWQEEVVDVEAKSEQMRDIEDET